MSYTNIKELERQGWKVFPELVTMYNHNIKRFAVFPKEEQSAREGQGYKVVPNCKTFKETQDFLHPKK